MSSYFSHGKFLLSAEYLIMFGAKGLAFPVKYGQRLDVSANDQFVVDWAAYSPDGLWFTCTFDLPSFQISSASDEDKALYLQKLLKTIHVFNSQAFDVGVKFKTVSDFNMEWGLGSSSTLIANLANWSQINLFELFYAVSKGSGYDIACASSNKPISFERNNNSPIINEISFEKLFLENLYLVYSGSKKRTEKHVAKFENKGSSLINEIQKATALTERFVHTQSLSEFVEIMQEHEKLISSVVGESPVQKRLFPDYKGAIKSLGAWGGDFYLAATSQDPEYNTSYFEQFGLSTIIPFEKIALV